MQTTVKYEDTTIALEPLRIGDVIAHPPLVLGPMAGVTSLPFRLICRRAGAGLVCSEMVSADAVTHGNTKTKALLTTCPQEKPLSIQVFGADPDTVAEAARHVEAAGADIIDLNMGCSVRKVLRAGAGAMLMAEPERAVAIAAAVVRAVRVPVTVKMRLGWNPDDRSYVDLSRRLIDVGIAAVTLHARTVGQGYRNRADWGAIARLVESLQVPVIGNGDVFTAEDALRMKKQTNCAAVMIARGALGNPMIFAQASALIAGQKPPEFPPYWRLAIALWQAQASVLQFGERLGLQRMRPMACWYTRGLPNAVKFRREVSRIHDLQHFARAILSLAANKPTNSISGTHDSGSVEDIVRE